MSTKLNTHLTDFKGSDRVHDSLSRCCLLVMVRCPPYITASMVLCGNAASGPDKEDYCVVVANFVAACVALHTGTAFWVSSLPCLSFAVVSQHKLCRETDCVLIATPIMPRMSFLQSDLGNLYACAHTHQLAVYQI